MRISSQSSDPGHKAFLAARRHGKVVVRVDGEVLADCVTADTKRGCAVVYERDADGVLELDRTKTRILMLQIHGQVEIAIERPTQ